MGQKDRTCCKFKVNIFIRLSSIIDVGIIDVV